MVPTSHCYVDGVDVRAARPQLGFQRGWRLAVAGEHDQRPPRRWLVVPLPEGLGLRADFATCAGGCRHSAAGLPAARALDVVVTCAHMGRRGAAA
eukprot:4723090-Pleurochrysis_carterae.AAC.1